MNKLIIFILTLLPVFSYSQVTSINIDTSASQVIIINNGTMIENNGGTVNVNNNYSVDEISQTQIHSVNKEYDPNLLKNDTRCDFNGWYPYKDPLNKGNSDRMLLGIIIVIVIFVLGIGFLLVRWID